ncbi:transmembrane and immunoglobulin domain-containing protein 1 isoform X2 [Trachemys scripta elegans]|uniref:transmembrane and immunoglobulin domain-containing protein 1 isoform X1 n=1 Tax=Trachemys scripta elegans TaxID=31138 RepID=UPI001552675F|nr:transmembrane and immunoglobulin domain-containing protein 1 isoform X1 [Trachemys scripta elegans]XP_034608878.1 transmembrane and immunoglobulin domain-containing protein 1 isoform X2 [Trachemys scripta elegans]
MRKVLCISEQEKPLPRLSPRSHLNRSEMAQKSRLPAPYGVPVLAVLLLPCLVTGVELAINNSSDNQILSTKPGRDESLWCTVRNNSRAEELRWYRGDGTVNLKDGNKINTTNICILPVSKTDNGVSFTCKLVRNESIQISVTLDVQFPPLLTGEDPPPVEEKNDVKLTCNVNSNPQAEMVWYKDNSTLTLKKDRYQIYHTSEVFQLTIKKVEKSDNGTYTCEAKSVLGEMRKEFHLTVEDRKPVFPLEAIIAAIVVVLLTVIFGIVARREKIFKCFKKTKKTPSETAL